MSCNTGKINFRRQYMSKGSGSKGGSSPPRGGKGGVGFIPNRPGGNKPAMTGNKSGKERGNLLPKKTSGN